MYTSKLTIESSNSKRSVVVTANYEQIDRIMFNYLEKNISHTIAYSYLSEEPCKSYFDVVFNDGSIASWSTDLENVPLEFKFTSVENVEYRVIDFDKHGSLCQRLMLLSTSVMTRLDRGLELGPLPGEKKPRQVNFELDKPKPKKELITKQTAAELMLILIAFIIGFLLGIAVELGRSGS